MNRRLGVISSIAVAAATVGFAASMLVSDINLSYLSSLMISWSYVLMACALASEVSPDKKAVALGGVAFAAIYAVFVDLVYFTQLTAVRFVTEVPDVISAVTYTPGSWFFALDLFGYGMMAVSTLLLGIAFTTRSRPEKWLRVLLMLHGLFAPACVLMPMLGLFKRSAQQESGLSGGVLALFFWCIYFTPLAVLSAVHFCKSSADRKD